ncbi:protein kinase domain-containing protein [Aerosakkonema funiforme]|uniref:protein kinase domain-containing protein n=1 Tax=Aerosakkonema funiforme TaxID=1246630 RepID=UPI0035BAB134
MSYCFNPDCSKPDDPLNFGQLVCRHCGTELLLKNRYRGVKRLGKGGFCQIIEVDDSGIHKVLKMLLVNYPKVIDLFKREAEVLTLLYHPGIPRVELDSYFTFRTKEKVEPLHCIVMEKIEGLNLKEWQTNQNNQPIPEELAINWLKQLVKILQELHKSKYFHRDIKPENIMLKPDGQLALIDFNAVREITDTYLAKVGVGRDITQIGSKGYIPPEQVMRKAVPQSDFFALGRTFVHLLTGIHPLDLDEDPETDKLIWRNYAPQISSYLADLIDWLMAPTPRRRPQNTGVVLQLLKEIEYLIKNENNLGFGKLINTFKFLKLFNRKDNQNPYLIKLNSVRFQIGLVALLLLGIVTWRLVSSQIAIALNDRGVEHYEDGGIGIAAAWHDIKQAVELNPNDSVAIYNWGALCEQLGNFDCAREKYQIAAQSGVAAAYNQLARLYIIHYKNDAVALNLLWQGLALNEDGIDVKYSLLKNLGWVRLKQQRYDEAKKHLQDAIKLDSDRASAYCLLAQVKEAQKDIKDSLVHWENCRKYADMKNPDEDNWMSIAEQRLRDKK